MLARIPISRAAPTYRARSLPLAVYAKKGFGASTSSKAKTSKSPLRGGGRGALRQKLADDSNQVLSKKSNGRNLAGTFDEGSSPWVDVGVNTADFNAKGKDTIARVLASKDVVVLYRAMAAGANAAASYFCSDANSTAFKYPMIDAKVSVDETSGEVFAESPFDGSVYSLTRNGAVETWCPKSNPGRAILSALKSKEEPTPLRTYPVRVVEGGKIEVKFSSSS